MEIKLERFPDHSMVTFGVVSSDDARQVSPFYLGV
jgi:hypothetical protein